MADRGVPAPRVVAAVACLWLLAGGGRTGADLRVVADTVVGYDAFAEHVTARHPDIDRFYLRTLYDHYVRECRIEGVSLLVALSQMLLETDYLRFTGSVRAVQYNYAGIGATDTGVAGDVFPNMRTGVRAHVQHLKAYGDAEPLSQVVVDPRFHLVRRGSAQTVPALTGRWATDPAYHEKLLAHAERLSASDVR